MTQIAGGSKEKIGRGEFSRQTKIPAQTAGTFTKGVRDGQRMYHYSM